MRSTPSSGRSSLTRSRGFRLAALLLCLIASNLLGASRVSMWIPPWDSLALTSLQTIGARYDESNPTWYTVSADGSLVAVPNGENPSWRAAMSGTKLIPTIQNLAGDQFDGAVIDKIVTNAVKREAHVEALRRLVVEKAYDGIDLDYEGMSWKSRAGFSEFVTLLASRLHSAGAELSITVYAKTNEAAKARGSGAQDWALIGSVADSVKIMVYDYHYPGTGPGPIAPLSWIGDVATYALKMIPAQKITIGLPWYGYSWQGLSGFGISYRDAIIIAQSKGAAITHDANGEATYTYADRVVFFQDSVSYQRKIDFIRESYPAITSFAHWRLGGEDPRFWDTIARLRGTGGGEPEPRGDFTIAGPREIAVEAGRAGEASYFVVPIDGFSETVTVSAEMIDSFDGSVSLTRSDLAPGATTTLRVAPSAPALPGVYRVRLRFVTSRLAHETLTFIDVKPAPESFEVTGPERIALGRGATGFVEFQIRSTGSQPALVSLTSSPIDTIAGGTTRFVPESVMPGAPARLELATSTVTFPGTYRVLLRFESRGIVRERTLTIDVVTTRKRIARR